MWFPFIEIHICACRGCGSPFRCDGQIKQRRRPSSAARSDAVMRHTVFPRTLRE